jgi:hypothetical protein
MIRPSPASFVDFVAWGVVIILAAAAVALTLRLGPVGLVLLGLLTLFVCVRFSIDEASPTWGTEVFRARMTRPRSPEQRAADATERAAFAPTIRFCRCCGTVLILAGGVALAYQRWG